jgi:hypothetical protein
MFEKLIICIQPKSLSASLWRAGRLVQDWQFQADEAGQQAFFGLLKRYPQTRLYALVDSVEEDYRLESLPHVQPFERREMVERKLNQMFRGAQYRMAQLLYREADKRKDDRFMFLSLGRAEFLEPWIVLLEKAQVPLVGIYPLASMSQMIARQLGLKSPHALLIERLQSGLRQTYLCEASLRISRLAPIPDEMQAKLPYFCLTETEKTRLYLLSQRLINRDVPLQLLLLNQHDLANGIAQAIEQEQHLECQTVDISPLLAQSGLQASQLSRMPELLHMYFVAQGKGLLNLAPPQLGKRYRLNMLRLSINAASLVTLLVAICGALYFSYRMIDLTKQQREAEQQTLQQQTQYEEVAKNFPKSPLPSTELQLLATLKSRVEAHDKTPLRMMQVISRGLQTMPDIALTRLYWQQTAQLDVGDSEQRTGLQVRSGNVSAGTAPEQLYEIGFMQGEIRPFDGDYRAALAKVQTLVEHYKKDADVAQIEVVQAPVNVSSQTDLKGSTTDADASLKIAALFKLKLVLNASPVPARQGGKP